MTLRSIIIQWFANRNRRQVRAQQEAANAAAYWAARLDQSRIDQIAKHKASYSRRSRKGWTTRRGRAARV